jgi:hypothetical protein
MSRCRLPLAVASPENSLWINWVDLFSDIAEQEEVAEREGTQIDFFVSLSLLPIETLALLDI